MKQCKLTAILLAVCFLMQSSPLSGFAEQEDKDAIVTESVEPVAVESASEDEPLAQEEAAQTQGVLFVPSDTDFDKNGRCQVIMPDPQGRTNSATSVSANPNHSCASHSNSAHTTTFQCGMPDDEFFGVWDGEQWTKQPLLNYNYFNEDYVQTRFAPLAGQLSAVEEAVKLGDIEQAKAALLEYYRGKEAIFPTDKLDKSSKEDHLRAELYMDNFIVHINEKVLDIVTVDETPQYTKVDVTDGVQAMINNDKGTITILVAAVKKDGSKVAFDSINKTGGNKPYLDIKVNGGTTRVYATDDTYLSAGENRSKAFGTEDTLYVKESAAGTFPAIDEQTAQTVLRFDFSKQFRKGDTFQNAVLGLYGSNVGGTGNAKLVVMSNGSTSWTEADLNWMGYEHYAFSYDGEYGPNWTEPTKSTANPANRFREELYRFSTWIDKLVGQYNVTGREEYAFHAIRYMMDFVYNRSADWDAALDMAVRGSAVPGYISQLLHSEAMTPERFTALLKWCYQMAEAENQYTDTNNWGITESEGKYAIMLWYPELARYRQWEQRIQTRMEELVGGVREDGSSMELSLGYCDYWIGGTCNLIKLANQFGVKCVLTDYTIDTTYKMMKYQLDMVSPGGGDPQQADSYNYKARFKNKQAVLDMATYQKDEILKWMYYDGKQGTKPDYTSALYPIGKKLALRSDWGDNAVYLHMNADGAEGSHGHYDDLSIVIMAYGTYLLSDQRYVQTATVPGYNWLKSSKAHNLVEINETEQKRGSGGKVERSEFNGGYDYVSMSTTNYLSPNKAYRNVLFLRPDFFIVNDYVQPGDATVENTFNTYWHFEPIANFSFDSESKIIRTNFDGPNLQIVPTDPDMISWIGTKDGYYAGDGNSIETKYMQTDAKKKGNISMTNVLYPNDTGKEREIQTEPLELGLDGNGSASVIRILDKQSGAGEEFTYAIINDPTKVSERVVGAYSMNGALLAAQRYEDETPRMAILQDATHLKDIYSDTEWIYSKTKIKELSVNWMQDSLLLNASSAPDLKALTIYHPGEVKMVKLNGERIPFQVKGGYVYFGAEPIIDAGDQPPTGSPSPSNPPSHGNSGSGGVVTPPVLPSVPPSAPPELPSGELPEHMKQELAGHWGEAEITSMIQRGIVKGVTEDSIGLAQPVTRAEFAAMLSRAIPLPDAKMGRVFSDVSEEQWYAASVAAAFEAGLMRGDGDAFRPDAFMTRQELAMLLAAVAEREKLKLEQAGGLTISDADQVSEWAAEAVSKAMRSGLMQGMEDGRFAPLEEVKREQAIVVLYRLLERMEGESENE